MEFDPSLYKYSLDKNFIFVTIEDV